jgi:DNA modification methylase
MAQIKSPRICFKSYDKIVSLKTLKKNKFQRNVHPKPQIERLAKIMSEHGIRHPIHISKRSGQVCFGHGRWAAALANGWTNFPVVYQDFKTAAEEFACVQSDNAIAGWAELDLEGIKTDLVEFKDLDINLLGIDGFEIPSDDDKKGLEDEIPEKVEARTKLGDLYILGDHRLLCGDSTNTKDVARLMDGQKADLWIADPPFGVSYMEKNAAVHGGIVKNQTGKEIKSDTKTVAEISPLWKNAAERAFEFTTNEASNYWCACQGSDKMMMMMMMMMDEAGWNIRHELIWVKSSMVFGRSDYHYRHEPIIYGWKKTGKHNWFSDRKQTSVFEIDRPSKSDLHPTTKPVELFEHFVRNSTRPNHLVLESFGGSGTTLIACEKLKRKSNTMELDPHYCDVIVTRWEKYSGKKAKLINAKACKKASKK